MCAYKLKGKSKSHRQEEKSLRQLSSLINLDEIDIKHEGGVIVSVDGEIGFVDKQTGKPSVFTTTEGKDVLASTKYQLKSSVTKGTKSCDFSIEDITSYALHPFPVFIFFVDIPGGIVYWELINIDYVQKILGIADLQSTTVKYKRIKFRPDKIFDGVTDRLFQDFKEPDLGIPSQARTLGTQTAISGKELVKHKKSIGLVVQEDLEKVYALEALVFFHSPFVITDPSVLQSLLTKSELEEWEFHFYTKKLVSAGIMTRVGDVVAVSDTKAAQALLGELINKKGIEYIYG